LLYDKNNCGSDHFNKIEIVFLQDQTTFESGNFVVESGGDTHQSMTKGARSDLLVQQLPENGLNVELLVAPKDGLIDVEAAVQRCI